ncbi:MAG TPA: galactosyldiacylglycerol synthase [Desulfomonilia bacterium]
MIKLYNKDNNSFIGTITEEDLLLLEKVLVEESETDTDYFINPDTIDLIEDSNASPELISLLRSAVGQSDGIEISWKKR